MRITFLFLLLAAMVSCSEPIDPQKIIDKAIQTHGGLKLESSRIEFDFRNKHYTMQMSEGQSEYTRSFQDSLGNVRDVLINSSALTRYVNDTVVNLTEEWEGKYGNSVNSVLYFTKLPLGLNDPAVVKEYIGEKYINREPYHKIRVTFQQEGGGTDHEDVFVYWFHQEKGTLDYLAYKYLTDGGGTRFRQAINRRIVEGITFQDYVNYKAESKEVPVENHDEYFETGKLIELSRIINENIVVK